MFRNVHTNADHLNSALARILCSNPCQQCERSKSKVRRETRGWGDDSKEMLTYTHFLLRPIHYLPWSLRIRTVIYRHVLRITQLDWWSTFDHFCFWSVSESDKEEARTRMCSRNELYWNDLCRSLSPIHHIKKCLSVLGTPKNDEEIFLDCLFNWYPSNRWCFPSHLRRTK